jgi:hypothetical protein
MRVGLAGLLFAATAIGVGGAGAQAATPVPAPAEKWEFTIAPYVLFPNMQGSSAIGNLPAVSVDATPSDIFSHLQSGAMLYFEVKKGKWAFATDALFMDLKQDISPDGGRVSGSLKARQGAWEGFLFYKFVPKLEIGIGGLANKLDASFSAQLSGGGAQTAKSKSESWGAPVLAMRWTPWNTERWHGYLFADYGGTSGSNWTWQAMPGVGYRFSKLFELSLQYRWIGVNYSTGSGADYFSYRMNIFGPQMGFGFHF